jgi:predicted GNAT superfamily acetyltransferase
MSLRWYSVVIDCHDIAAQARWWAGVLDWQITYEADDEVVIVPKHVTEGYLRTAPWEQVGPGLVFVRVPEDKTVKNRLHIDLAPQLDDDRAAMVESLIAKGATRADVGQDEHEATWVVLADPEGNEFCVLSSRAQ